MFTLLSYIGDLVTVVKRGIFEECWLIFKYEKRRESIVKTNLSFNMNSGKKSTVTVNTTKTIGLCIARNITIVLILLYLNYVQLKTKAAVRLKTWNGVLSTIGKSNGCSYLQRQRVSSTERSCSQKKCRA